VTRFHSRFERVDMQSIINDALKNAELEKEINKPGSTNAMEDDFVGQPRIVIIGCGGAGNNTVNRIHHMGVSGAETIAINTDKQHLDMIQADKRILIGKSLTKGLGAGGYPDVGKRAAEMARPTLEAILESADLVFITAGMGGGTGTGSAPVVAQVAKEQGAIVVGMVSYPFQVEKARLIRAEEGLEALASAADSVIVLDNNRLKNFVPNLPLGQAFSVMDQLIGETVKGISETITEPSLINIDYADVRAIMSKGGVAVMLVGESKQQNKAESVVRECLSNPMLDIDYRGATGSLIHITGGTDLTLQDAEEVATSLTYELDPHADVIWGARVRSDMEGKIRVLAIMTGVKSAQILGTRQSYKTMIEDIESKRSNPKAVEMPVARRSGRDQPSGGGVLEWVG
jgi:cell division protein FtsZ